MGVLQDQDRVACTYRGHGNDRARIVPLGLMAEITGRAIGTCGARAGSMNVVDLDHKLIGCFGIVGGSLAAATGAGALAEALQRRRGRLLRRRHGQPGLLPRVPQLRQGALAPGRLRLREQPVRRVHPDGAGHPRRDPRPATGAGDPGGAGRRPGRVGDARGGRAGGRAGPVGGGRSSSRRTPTATPTTAEETRSSTGPRARWSDGGSATRSISRAARLVADYGADEAELDAIVAATSRPRSSGSPRGARGAVSRSPDPLATEFAP